jgi:hypothetical protein
MDSVRAEGIVFVAKSGTNLERLALGHMMEDETWGVPALATSRALAWT